MVEKWPANGDCCKKKEKYISLQYDFWLCVHLFDPAVCVFQSVCVCVVMVKPSLPYSLPHHLVIK